MRVEQTILPDALIVIPQAHVDDRGSFFESWNQQSFDRAVGSTVAFVQDNQSVSSRGVLRGIHYQLPEGQGKLVRVVSGSVWDVAVDLRKSSATFGRSVGIELSGENLKQLWIPPGFGHGFVCMSERAVVSYKVTTHYDPSNERAIRYDDPDIRIAWPMVDVVVSARDRAAPLLRDAEVFG